MLVIILYLAVINFIGFYLMKNDKQRAKQHQFRIREKTLWLVAVLFGAIGMTAGMNVFRHKTRHLNFKIGLPALAVIEAAIFFYALKLLS